MGSQFKSLIFLFATATLTLCCVGNPSENETQTESYPQYEPISDEPQIEEVESESGEPKETVIPDTPSEPEVSEPEDWWMEYPWERAVKPLVFDDDGTPLPLQTHPRSYYKISGLTKQTTLEIHRQIAIAVGLKVTEKKTPRLAKFLSARASMETSSQGNQRPFDTRGVVHSLDVKAAWRSGMRNRDKYVEAGNILAKERPYVFLGYGQGGMISWLFLDNWDMLGDPRMLGDSVIGGLTYRRSLVDSYKKLSSSRIQCYEYDDVGKVKVTGFNGKKYRVGQYAIDDEKYQACIDDGPKDRSEKKNESKLERRCFLSSRKTYKWKPGMEQPENTVPVPKITWWRLKRSSGGKPCPSWKGDTYVKHIRAKLGKHAAPFDLDLDAVVRLKDLGEEPEGVNQYSLWKKIWDATMIALNQEPINWENLRLTGREVPMDIGPSPEKIEQERRRARGENIDPFARKSK